jgi:hypothetical protein
MYESLLQTILAVWCGFFYKFEARSSSLKKSAPNCHYPADWITHKKE